MLSWLIVEVNIYLWRRVPPSLWTGSSVSTLSRLDPTFGSGWGPGRVNWWYETTFLFGFLSRVEPQRLLSCEPGSHPDPQLVSPLPWRSETTVSIYSRRCILSEFTCWESAKALWSTDGLWLNIGWVTNSVDLSSKNDPCQSLVGFRFHVCLRGINELSYYDKSFIRNIKFIKLEFFLWKF